MIFTVYSKPNCPACDQAKALLSSNELDYQEIILDMGQPKLPGKQYVEVQAFKAENPTVRMMPFILQQDTVIGGINDLRLRLSNTAL